MKRKNKIHPVTTNLKPVSAQKKSPRLLVFPASRLMNNGLPNPKNYPLFADVIRDVRAAGVQTVQCGISTENSVGCDERIQDITPEVIWNLAMTCDAFLSVDSFFPHMAKALMPEYQGKHNRTMPGVVVWVVTDHQHFGYPEFENIYSGKPTPCSNMLLPMELAATEVKDKGVNAPPHGKIVQAVLKVLSIPSTPL